MAMKAITPKGILDMTVMHPLAHTHLRNKANSIFPLITVDLAYPSSVSYILHPDQFAFF